MARPIGQMLAAAVVALMPGFATGGTLVDFTVKPKKPKFVYDLGFTTMRLKAVGGPLNANTPKDGCSASFLACENDGLSVGKRGDEINGREKIVATFSDAVQIDSIYFLDLFHHASIIENETAVVDAFTSEGSSFSLSFKGSTMPYGDGGFLAASTPSLADIVSLSFSVGSGNDGIGVSDFALAGLEVSQRNARRQPPTLLAPTPVPLPPAGFLLLGALSGFLWLGRRRRLTSA